MTRYFFDVATDTSIRYDYRGRDFERPEQAQELAQLIALDLGCGDGDSAMEGEVQVRDLRGGQLFSVQIPVSELVAA